MTLRATTMTRDQSPPVADQSIGGTGPHLGRDTSPPSARNSSKGALLSEAFAVFRALSDGTRVDELRAAALETRLFRQELDELLRCGVFVDLNGVVRKGIRAGIDSYSVKKLEPFYGLVREVDLRRVSRLLRAVEYAIAKKDAGSLSEDICESVRSYNRDDCVSAMDLRACLPVERDGPQQAQWILAQLLEWHRREDKVDWWEFFRLNDMTSEELLDQRAGLAGLVFEQRLETTKRGVVVDRYRLPSQDTDVEEQDDAYEPGSEKVSPIAKVEGLDLEQRTVDLRNGAARAEHHLSALFKQDKVSNADAVHALLRLGESVRDRGTDSPGAHRAERDLLLRLNPRLLPGQPLRRPGESTVASARRAALALDGGVLAVQGPPGAGKTFTGARMIVDLVRAGRRVGVTAGSHKVIGNLLDDVVRAAAEEGCDFAACTA